MSSKEAILNEQTAETNERRKKNEQKQTTKELKPSCALGHVWKQINKIESKYFILCLYLIYLVACDDKRVRIDISNFIRLK